MVMASATVPLAGVTNCGVWEHETHFMSPEHLRRFASTKTKTAGGRKEDVNEWNEVNCTQRCHAIWGVQMMIDRARLSANMAKEGIRENLMVRCASCQAHWGCLKRCEIGIDIYVEQEDTGERRLQSRLWMADCLHMLAFGIVLSAQ